MTGEGTPAFTVAGQVTVNGAPLQDVQVALSGSRTASATTGADGRYSFPGLAAGGDYTVTPSLANHIFTPPSRTFNALSADQTADFTASTAAIPSGGGRVNVALSSYGANAAASSTLDAGRAAVAAINGDRRGVHWGSDPSTGSGWHDNTPDAFPDWLEITFPAQRIISEVNVFTVQDNFTSPSEPTEAMTFTKYGIQDFDIEYWTGSAWALVPGGAITNNDKVWRKLTFAPLTTTKIRLVVKRALADYSRVIEVEAWGPVPKVNFALASNGATAVGSSTLDAGRAALAAINGDRKGIHWESDPATGSGWHDATPGVFPDWLEITFAGQKTISEVDVFSVQDDVLNPSEPTEAMTFTKWGVQDFDVEYWTGSAWQVVPGGSVVNNNKVWARVTFTPLTTTKIRVVVKRALAEYSRITEVEAWG